MKNVKFAERFSRSTIRENSFFVRHSKFAFSEFYYGLKTESENWKKVVQASVRLESVYEDEESSSPINATSHRLTFAYLDGGLISRQGDYFCGLKGAWIIGIKALRFACYETGTLQPRRFKEEMTIPSHRDLIDEAFSQIETREGELMETFRELKEIT